MEIRDRLGLVFKGGRQQETVVWVVCKRLPKSGYGWEGWRVPHALAYRQMEKSQFQKKEAFFTSQS